MCSPPSSEGIPPGKASPFPGRHQPSGAAKLGGLTEASQLVPRVYANKAWYEKQPIYKLPLSLPQINKWKELFIKTYRIIQGSPSLYCHLTKFPCKEQTSVREGPLVTPNGLQHTYQCLQWFSFHIFPRITSLSLEFQYILLSITAQPSLGSLELVKDWELPPDCSQLRKQARNKQEKKAIRKTPSCGPA